MFVLYEMERSVRIDPVNLHMERVEAITDELNRTLSNRVMINVGLCIALWDIKSIGDPTIFPGDGAVISKVNFRYIIFRPFREEVLIGKIKNCTTEGVHVTLGFFDDILIPPEGLQFPSRFDEREQIWIWDYTTPGEDGEESHEMYMDKGETIRFRIISENFTDTSPLTGSQTTQQPSTSTMSASTISKPVQDASNLVKAPYNLIASINEPGLGLLTWWN